jgi:hypothetical protein|tara:strand:+ start:603 stop:857 length:255 start_codon:yes stop_codon:yes gene_type:complete
MREISTYNDEILIEGCEYSVGTNDGKEFSKVAFEGYKKLYGKTMLSFRTNNNKQVTINPSYMSFAIEEDTEMNVVTYKQSTEKE